MNHGRRCRASEIPVSEPRRTSPIRRAVAYLERGNAAVTPNSVPGRTARSRRWRRFPSWMRTPPPPLNRPHPQPWRRRGLPCRNTSAVGTGDSGRPIGRRTSRSPAAPRADRPGGSGVGRSSRAGTRCSKSSARGMGTVYRAGQTQPVKRQSGLQADQGRHGPRRRSSRTCARLRRQRPKPTTASSSTLLDKETDLASRPGQRKAKLRTVRPDQQRSAAKKMP